MTMDPGEQALVDQATASASRFVDDILAEMVTLIDRGMPHTGVIEQVGGGLAMHELNATQVLVVAAVSTARLARLHHAIEHLADSLAAAAANVPERPAAPAELMYTCTVELRKLVEDHG